MVYFIGAGPGDPELLTIKAKRVLERAEAILYTGSLIPKEVLKWSKKGALIQDSQNMDYSEIFEFLERYGEHTLARVHTGEPSLYSTINRQIEFLKSKNIQYKIIPGISACFGASSSLGIEYTIPGLSQTLILTRIGGKTPNPESLNNILRCKNSSLVFYLSITLLEKLKQRALEIGYSPNTPCWVVEKATWRNEKIYKGTIDTISHQTRDIKGIALILLGDFLYQKAKIETHLYNKKENK